MLPIEIESPSDYAAVETLHNICFGLQRHTRPSYAFRLNVGPLHRFCAVIREKSSIVAGVRYWPIEIAGASEQMLLLGPLAVHPDYANRGYGRALVTHTLGAAKQEGYRRVVLVGDPGYFRRFEFKRLAGDPLMMPGAEPEKLLARWIGEGTPDWPSGVLVPSGSFDMRQQA